MINIFFRIYSIEAMLNKMFIFNSTFEFCLTPLGIFTFIQTNDAVGALSTACMYVCM